MWTGVIRRLARPLRISPASFLVGFRGGSVSSRKLMLTAKQTVLEEFRAAYASKRWDEALKAVGSECFASSAFQYVCSEHHFLLPSGLRQPLGQYGPESGCFFRRLRCVLLWRWGISVLYACRGICTGLIKCVFFSVLAQVLK